MGTIERFFDERKYSEISEEFPDKERFPLYYEAKRQEFTIGPGQKLFIPAGWFHFVFSEPGFNYAINYWYNTDWVDDGSVCKEPCIEKHMKTRKDIGNPRVRVVHSKTNFFPSKLTAHRYKDLISQKDMLYKDFLDGKDPHLYLVQHQVNKSSKKEVFMTNIWVNFGGVYSSIHYDLKDNWLCQVEGTKRVILFPQDQRDKLYLWNPYQLELLHKIMSPFNSDQFIRRSLTSLPLDMCKRILDSNSDIIHDDKLKAICKLEIDTYVLFLEKTGSATPSKREPSGAFSRKVPTVPIYPFVFFWTLTPGSIRIRNFNWKVEPGECYIFPLSFTYPWMNECEIFVPV